MTLARLHVDDKEGIACPPMYWMIQFYFSLLLVLFFVIQQASRPEEVKYKMYAEVKTTRNKSLEIPLGPIFKILRTLLQKKPPSTSFIDGGGWNWVI